MPHSEMRKRKPTKGRKCPICGHANAAEFKPFCSKRCADADLVRWLKGAYAIPDAPLTDEERGEDADDEPGGSGKPQ
jgi:hypothetical protein